MVHTDCNRLKFLTSYRYTFKRGEALPLYPKFMWEIQDGVLRTVTWDEEATVITMGIWGPGDVVGQPLSRPDPYQLECLTSVSARILPADYQCAHELMLAYAEQMEQLLKIIRVKTVKGRLLQFLNWLAQRFGHRVEQGHLIGLRLSHREVAEAIGTTRVTITRLLRQLECEGRLEWSGQYWVLTGNSLS